MHDSTSRCLFACWLAWREPPESCSNVSEPVSSTLCERPHDEVPHGDGEPDLPFPGIRAQPLPPREEDENRDDGNPDDVVDGGRTPFLLYFRCPGHGVLANACFEEVSIWSPGEIDLLEELLGAERRVNG
jgi:hypothetical protein